MREGKEKTKKERRNEGEQGTMKRTRWRMMAERSKMEGPSLPLNMAVAQVSEITLSNMRSFGYWLELVVDFVFSLTDRIEPSLIMAMSSV
mmetsp:Transcript_26551/g.56484  ORF Transcript_26551/g.56484 Transcript_26551/m.56484 type:complete len:90 (+) Transcript_26551:35-304(+)